MSLCLQLKTLTMNLIISGEFSVKCLKYVLSAERNLGGQKFRKDCELETADNTGYVLITTRNIKSSVAIL
jgi:hypothetical protein